MNLPNELQVVLGVIGFAVLFIGVLAPITSGGWRSGPWYHRAVFGLMIIGGGSGFWFFILRHAPGP